jgi:hypothetical protein
MVTIVPTLMATIGKRLQQGDAVGWLDAKSGKVYHNVYAIGYYL